MSIPRNEHTKPLKISLHLAEVGDAERLWKMQVGAFSEMYEKYRDEKTSPAAEKIGRTVARLKSPDTYYYFILADGEAVGAIRVIDPKDGRPKRISPIFIMPPYRKRGIAQEAVLEAERLHGASGWELETVLQEAASCRLYEKLGYRRAGEPRPVNDRMTLVTYIKE